MKRQILNYLKQHKLTDTKVVDSLIVSVFLRYKNIEVKNNSLLTEYLDLQFENKDKLIEELLEIISRQESVFGFEELIQLFEFVISPAERVINGAIYTPKIIREFIISQTLAKKGNKNIGTSIIADISCGCGAFLVDAARFLKEKIGSSYQKIFQQNIYGLDIEEYSITRTKILLSLLALSEGEDTNFIFNLFVGDALSFLWHDHVINFQGFDFILGNPPYVTSRHLTDKTRELISKKRTCQSGNPDLYIPFFEIGVENLSSYGILGYITMNSFFKSLNARGLRQYFQEKALGFRIYDFGSEQIFQARNTYTCICIIENCSQNAIKYTQTKPGRLNDQIEWELIAYEDLDAYNGWNLKNHKVISKIEKTGKPLGHLYQTSHGLATLRNNIFIFTPVKEDQLYYYLDNGNKLYPIEKDICCDVINSNKLSRCYELNSIKEKLIFPYTDEKKPQVIEEDFFKSAYPKAYEYLNQQKYLLGQRDKGKGKYSHWYAYGRSQGLEQIKHKMFFPKYSDQTPHYLIHSDKRLYFYNGQAFFGESVKELEILKRILETRLFWFYIASTSKPYSSNYYSLNGTYIKNFGICDLSEEEKEFILSEDDKSKLDVFFEKKYGVNLDRYIS